MLRLIASNIIFTNLYLLYALYFYQYSKNTRENVYIYNGRNMINCLKYFIKCHGNFISKKEEDYFKKLLSRVKINNAIRRLLICYFDKCS